jgi:hypothetical protein
LLNILKEIVMDKLHTIKPLEWEVKADGLVRVDTIAGRYYVDLGLSCKWAFFSDRYPFDSFSEHPCTSIEDGKAQAEKHYREQLIKCLEVYND